MDILSAQSGPISLSEFEQAVRELDTLETMPAAAQRILSITSNPESGIDDVYDLVATDPTLAAGAMRIASSAAFGGRPATKLSDALVRMGMTEIRRFVLAQSLMGSSSNTGPFHSAFWEYSLRCAAVSEALVKTLRIDGVEDPFLCGLLHDFGMLVLSRLRGKPYRDFVGTPDALDQQERERDKYGFAHTDLGAMVAASWNLFEALEHVMQFHHTPFLVEELALDMGTIQTVYVVALARECTIGQTESDVTLALCQKLKASPTQMEKACDRGLERYERMYAGMLNIPT